jgi:hypothetical protein
MPDESVLNTAILGARASSRSVPARESLPALSGAIARPPGLADLVITDLADSEAQLRERVATLEADVDIYRESVRVTLAQLHATKIVVDQSLTRISALVGDNHRLRSELRALGAQLRRLQCVSGT